MTEPSNTQKLLAELEAERTDTARDDTIERELLAAIEATRADTDFTDRAERLLERDAELIERLADT